MLKHKIIKVTDVKLPKRYNIKKHGITQSLLSAFPICRQRFLFKINGWQLKDHDGVFVFGNICHYLCEKIYKKKIKPSRILINRLIKKWKKEFGKDLSDFALIGLPRNMAVAEIVMFHYFKFYYKDFKMKFTAIEEEFCNKLGPYTLLGKKDLRYAVKNGEEMMEHKTKGRVEDDMLMYQLPFDFQNLFYITAQKLENDIDMGRVLYNIIRNPGLKQQKKENMKVFLERIDKDITKRPDFYFIRYEVPYSKTKKQSFKKELVYKLMETQKFLDGKMPLYKNESACKVPYKCDHLMACSSGTMTGYHQTDDIFPELDNFSFNPKNDN